MPDPIKTLQLENVVGSSAIDQELDLSSLAADLADAEYEPNRFPGLIYRTTDPKATNLLFRSGRIVTTGAQSIEDLSASVQILFDALDALGLPVPDQPDVTVRNMVCSADLGHQLNLNAIAIALGLEQVEYEPEQFPGLVYRLVEPSVVILLFGSGKAVVTGGNTWEMVEAGLAVVTSTLHDLDLLNG